MLLRNIDQSNGLCNGTRLQVVRLERTSIQAHIINGTHFGKTVVIPRLKISPSDKRLPLKIVRKQYPVSVSFAMTINKSQGQSLSRVGLYLPRPVFTHGQLYVAVSRVKSKRGLKVVICDQDGIIMFGVINYSHAQSAQQAYSFTPSIMWPGSDMQLYYYPQTVPLPVYMAQVPTVTAQTATLPQAFHTMTPQDPSWNMDTGASSHLTDNTGMLTSFSNSSIYPSVFVGNGNSIPVTHTGHSFLHTSHKPLHLNHILVTPHIIKNLISVRKFTRDNDVSVEFDAYGFSVKDYQTQKLLLRCDSTGDLYPVTQQPPLQTPVVLLSLSSTTWHRRLGHPGEDVLRRLESSNLISCNKSKSSALCHACQLGKHVKLPFYSSESSAKSIFEIIHSDIWTSLIPSESGIKYYAIFLDHFSHFVWVYPLHKKSDLFDNFVAFRAYVNKQFNVDIKALQCDHG
ncbi:ribonuclease H-like domain-containing protein, partial [Tanacetum coccineum]